MKQALLLTVIGTVTVISFSTVHATETPPPKIDGIVVSGPQKNLRVTPSPGAEAFYFYSATNLASPFLLNTNFVLMPYVTGYTTNLTTNGSVTITNLAYEWRTTNFPGDSGYFRMSATSVASNTTLGATVMNRLAYGPTPDDLPIVLANPQAFIDQQLDMGSFPPETMDSYSIITTNSISYDPTTNWTFVSIKGTLNTTNLYLFMTAPGTVFVDDIWLMEGTNDIPNPNLLVNGDFESPLTPPWVVTGGAAGSYLTNDLPHTGTSCLRLSSTVAGSTSGNNLRLPFITTLTNGTPVTLSYWYLPGPTSSKLKMQVGTGSQLVSSAGGLPSTPKWVYAKATGVASTTSAIYIYLSGAGTAYVDDMVLVAGTNAGVGPNLLQNGDFESPLGVTWTNSADFANSAVSTLVAHSGAGSLKVVATAAGSGSGDAVIQFVSPALVNNATYTVSYWYQPATPGGVTLTARLSGSGLVSNPDTESVGNVYRRLGSSAAQMSDYRAWFTSHAVAGKAQLFEILSQFLENHFVTQYSKSRDFLSGKGYGGTDAGVLATDWEWREMKKWREALANPNCTFYDLLKISAESPAQIVYLDTVNSKASGNNVANENYARELLELFTYGVDNGYDQTDIVNISRAWTGWSVELVDPENANDPFAPASVTFYPNVNSTGKPNTVGVWAFKYNAGNHGTNRGAIFPGKTVPARFGPPWAGRNYQLNIPARLTSATNSIQDGYDVIAHLANQPFTEEFISVKLCRLFVHDGFPNPTTRTDLTNDYAFYDYTDPNHSAEAELVRQCMLAWENSTPKGNIRAVLSTIFNSDLFRSHTANAQKVKTPLEFVVSTLRALRSVNPDGSTTASADGYSISSPLSRMGNMLLFDRDAPDGYAEDASPWISAGTLVERIRFVQSFCIPLGSTGHSTGDAGNNTCNPVALVKSKLPAGSWDNAGAVADYFLNLLYPAEGAANLALYRTAAVNFLNTNDTGTGSSTFSTLGNSSANYDTRVRGMVAMLMAMTRFQEQ